MIGKHYIVTGGTSGLGLDIVKQLLKRGAHVTVLARNIEKFNQIDFQNEQKHVKGIQCNLQHREDISQLEGKIKTPVDGLIYSSGLGYFKSIDNYSAEEMIETYDVNLIGFNLLYKVLRPRFVQHAHIIGISSQAAFVTQANAAHYGASKAAFNAVLNALRIEEPQFHIMSVNPGPIDTPFHEKADPTLSFFNKYKYIMIDSEQLATRIVEGILKNKAEINQPAWMHQLLKFYQLAPRTLERLLPKFFKTKE
ncbi:SDR family NAD(P)-dependent oxidoreductase [Staphylococcus caprae]|uniref:SDR family NAD(P)-dependent oxidoreductase n=1 Tax=Staphylococcus caprae TaxID=29380 RepID=UPI003B227209